MAKAIRVEVAAVSVSWRSPDWYRVEGLRLRLRSGARIHRQEYRGQLWYVLQDAASGRHHRFTPEAWFFISLFDGHRTIDEIWQCAADRLGDDTLSQGDVVRLLARLNDADVLRGDLLPDVETMLDAAARKDQRTRYMGMINPLALRLPMLDPDGFLEATLPLVRIFFTWIGVVAILGLLGYGGALAAIYWDALSANFADRVLARDNIILLLISYPLVKGIHELGHGYAVKRWGGEVHEIGVMFLVFMPVPYVDASEAARFAQKHRRMLVGAAGIIVEMMLASIATIIWVNAEDGLVRALAFNVMVIGGVSTLLFNGNPLLKFDGYYILSDWLEMPNLAPRGTRYLGYLINRHLFGVETAENPVTAPGEEKWLFGYTLVAFCYRLFITLTIVLFLADSFPILGMVLAGWSLLLMFGVPLGKQAWYLLTSPQLRRRRGRAMGVTGGALLTIFALVALLPLPHATRAEGVVWSAQDGAVRVTVAGEVARIDAAPNAAVIIGTPLLTLKDPLLSARLDVLGARAEELEIRLAAVPMDRPSEARVMRERFAKALEELNFARQQIDALVIRAPVTGTFVLPGGDAVLGAYVQPGQQIGHVVDFTAARLVVAVPENAADMVLSETREVRVRLADSIATTHPARVLQVTPELTDVVPAPALTREGGGPFSTKPPLDPGAPPRSLEPLMALELEMTDAVTVLQLGGRAHVLFRHPDSALMMRGWRSLRQLFLKRFDV